MNEMTINFDGKDYLATYNEQTGYYELKLTAPQIGGIYKANINFTDFWGQSYEDTCVCQVLAKEQNQIVTNKVFMWIFDFKDFSVKDIVEISDYDINIDEETNASTIVKILKKTTAKSRDIVAIKKNNEVIYCGIIDNIQNEDGKKLYEDTIKYITNLFNQNIELKKNKKIKDSIVNNSVYKIKLKIDENKEIAVNFGSNLNEAKIIVYDSTNTDNQKWIIEKTDDYYKIRAAHSNKFLTANGENLYQYENNNSDSQKWIIQKVQEYYVIKSKLNGKCIDIYNSETENGSEIGLYEYNNNDNQKFVLEEIEDEIIRKIGVEDFIAKAIIDNFISNDDVFINKQYLELDIKTHTTKQTSVSNVQDKIYNLHTWMTNCTQNYDIIYTFSIANKKLVISIENKSYDKELIDVQAQAISNYSEVFETDVVSKVIVLTSTDTYTLYLLNDRTTTTDKTNINRADGRIETVYTENYEEAEQKALDIMKSNSHNHNITFKMLDKNIKVGTPIAIKTKESLIFDTYISAIKITKNKFIEYTCGNIRIKFIDKLLKERRK